MKNPQPPVKDRVPLSVWVSWAVKIWVWVVFAIFAAFVMHGIINSDAFNSDTPSATQP